MKNVIEVRGLTKRFNGKTAVDNIDISVEKGEVFGLLGHNGAGKSTTIDCMLGLKKSDAGEVMILGMNPKTNRRKLFERVGVQLQSSSYETAIRVDEVCKQAKALYKNPADYMALLKKFGLAEMLKQPVDKLSGGEKQKLSIVLALMPNPEIIFLDELTTGLDTLARREVWKILKTLKNEGVTIFLTSHYMEEAEHLCDRVMIIKNGQCVALGTVNEIIENAKCTNLEDAYVQIMEEKV